MSDTKFTRDMFADPGDEAGVFIDALGRALITWAAMQNRTVTVNEASLSFNTTPEIIQEAIGEAMWIGIEKDGQTIFLDGE